MACLKEERAQNAKLPVTFYAPIVCSFQSTLDPALKEKVRRNLTLPIYCLAKENL